MKKTKYLIFITFILVSCTTLPNKDGTNEIEKAVNQATENLNGTIAIAELKGYADPTLENEIIFSIQSAIHNNNNLTLTDRNHINAVKREIAFNDTDFVNQNIKVSKGNIKGTYYVIYPTVKSTKKADILYFEILDISSSTLIATAKVNLSDIPGTRHHTNRLAENPFFWILIGAFTLGIPTVSFF